MARLIKRGTRYYVRVYIGAGKTRDIPAGTADRKAARRVRGRYEYEGNAAALPTKTPLPELLEEFVAHLAAQQPAKSVANDVSRLRTLFGCVAPRLEPRGRGRGPGRHGRTPPTILAVRHAEDIAIGLINLRLDERARSVGPKSVNGDREILSRLFRYAIEYRGLVHPETRRDNPVRQVRRRRERAPDIRFLSREQIDAQLAALADHPSVRLAAALMIYAGLRRGEALWLTARDVDRDAGLLRVRAKTIGGDRWQPKTARNRSVPISRALAAELDGFAARGGTRPPRCPWLCPSPEGTRWDPDNFSQALARANRAGGLPWSSLDFRHTFGSLLAQRGVSLYKISACMGNSPEICRRHYAALIPDALIGSVEFDGPPPAPTPEAPPAGAHAAAGGPPAGTPALRLVRA